MHEYRTVLNHSASQSPERQAVDLEQFVAVHSALYDYKVLGLGDPGALHRLIRTNLPDARRRADTIDQTAAVLREQLPRNLANCQAALPDFDWRFNIYLMPSCGALDGAGRIVDGAALDEFEVGSTIRTTQPTGHPAEIADAVGSAERQSWNSIQGPHVWRRPSTTTV